MLLGKCTREALKQKPYGEWFNKNYNDYKIDTMMAEKLNTKLKGKNFIIFMGTWCGDSRREVPRMYKLLDYCGVGANRIQLIMMNSYDSVYKQSPSHEERGFNIHRVPDLLVFEDEKEIGRIVESPVVSIEKDLFAIVNHEKYIPNYQIVPLLVNLFNQQNIEDIRSHLSEIAISAKPLMSNMAELKSYGHVLMAAGEVEKAAVVFELNALLYADNPAAFETLGDYYFKTGNKILAEENYQKSVKMKAEK
jgi:thiol-disulfide isomerase/thioredoxin